MLRPSALIAEPIDLATGLTLTACAGFGLIAHGDFAHTDSFGVSYGEVVCGPIQADNDGVYPGACDRNNTPERNCARRAKQAEASRSAQASRTPSNGSYWPTNTEGIRARWAAGWTGASPWTSQLSAMTLEERAGLSPTEKYDAFVGNYEYSLTLRAEAESPPAEFRMAASEYELITNTRTNCELLYAYFGKLKGSMRPLSATNLTHKHPA